MTRKYKLPHWLLEDLHNALLGEIYPEVRLVSFTLQGRRALLRSYLDRVPNDSDDDSIGSVATCVDAGKSEDLWDDFATECRHHVGKQYDVVDLANEVILYARMEG